MFRGPDHFRELTVALLAEGVDRNLLGEDVRVARLESPSSRRAWIEICECFEDEVDELVALLAEGVDRNTSLICWRAAAPCRPPRGGRG